MIYNLLKKKRANDGKMGCLYAFDVDLIPRHFRLYLYIEREMPHGYLNMTFIIQNSKFIYSIYFTVPVSMLIFLCWCFSFCCSVAWIW